MSQSLQKALEADLEANPDDLATHVAYADLLSEEDDPRGEFIQVQIALEDPEQPPERRKALHQREQDLLAAHEGHWLGALASHLLGKEGVTFTFRRGWLDTLEFDSLSLAAARILREAPQARLLRHLGLKDAYDQTEVQPDDNVPEGEFQRGFWSLVGSPNLVNLRSFRIGEDQGDDYSDYNGGLYTEAVVPLVRGMPNLEELYVFAKSFDLTGLFALPTLRRLRILKVYHSARVHRLDVLANNPAFHHLTHLLLHPHHLAWGYDRVDQEYASFHAAEGYIPLSVVRPLLRSPHLPHLTHLQLRLSSMGDEGCREIVDSGILKRLKGLDLRHGRITDEGARLLAECPDHRDLTWLDLSYNSLSATGMTLIQGRRIPGKVDNQHDPGEADEMTGEEDYLTEGDFE